MARTTKLGQSWRRRDIRWVLPAALASALLALCLLGASSAWAEGALSRFSAQATPTLETSKAPKLTKIPTAVTVEEGQSAVFEAAASGVPTPTAQWEVSTNDGVSWSPIEGATSDDYTIASASVSENGDELRVTFTNVAGSVTSHGARLTVQLTPAVTAQPVDVTVEEGQTAVFEATAAGFPEPTVLWELSTNGGSTWSKVVGGVFDQLTIAKTKTSDSGEEYRAVFKNSVGTATSDAATLTVVVVPAVTKQPLDTTVEEGQSAVFEATAAGFPTPSEQWELSTDGGSAWSPVAGATEPQLIIASAKVADNGDEYRAVFENVAGRATSEAATLSVQNAPAITRQPAGITVEVGQGAVFEAAGSGFPTPTEQWELSTDGGGVWSAVADATADRLTVSDTQSDESGDEYRLVFTNAAGKATSEAVTLTVAAHHYRVLGWGQNTYGQLGDGSLTQSDVPIPASGLNFVTAVAAGKRHSLALLANGTVMAWGYNGFGQLGDGTTKTRLAWGRVPLPTGTIVADVRAGTDHVLVRTERGEVYAWGRNHRSQVDSFLTGNQLTPDQSSTSGLATIRPSR